jgi:hypothetical protein
VDSSRGSSWPRRCAERHAGWICTVVGQQATRAVYCTWESVCDRLVDWDGAGIAVVRRAWRVWISVCALAFALPLFSVPFSFPFPLSFPDPLVLLLEESSSVPLLLHVVGLVPPEAFRGEWTRGHSSRSIPQSDCWNVRSREIKSTNYRKGVQEVRNRVHLVMRTSDKSRSRQSLEKGLARAEAPAEMIRPKDARHLLSFASI